MNIMKMYQALIRMGGSDAVKDFLFKGKEWKSLDVNDPYHTSLISLIARTECLSTTNDCFPSVESRLERLGFTSAYLCRPICSRIAARQKRYEDYLSLSHESRFAYRRGIFRRKVRDKIKQTFPKRRIKKMYSISPASMKIRMCGVRETAIIKLVGRELIWSSKC